MHVVDGTVVVTTLSGDESKPRVEIRTGSGTFGWTIHATATFERDKRSAPSRPRSTRRRDRTRCGRPLPAAAQRRPATWSCVPGDRRSHRLWLRCGSGCGPVAVRGQTGISAVHLHPVMVDIALQALGATKAATDLAGEGTAARRGASSPTCGREGSRRRDRGVCAIGMLAAT